jgi:hypothetical protein
MAQFFDEQHEPLVGGLIQVTAVSGQGQVTSEDEQHEGGCGERPLGFVARQGEVAQEQADAGGEQAEQDLDLPTSG